MAVSGIILVVLVVSILAVVGVAVGLFFLVRYLIRCREQSGQGKS